MKSAILILTYVMLLTCFYACSSSMKTERANPEAKMNEPMRHNNQADQPTKIGHQNDEIRDNNR